MSRLDRPTIDTIDFQLLENIQGAARASLMSLAYSAGLTSPPALRRLRKLRQSGVIRGYHAVLDGKKLGFDILCFMSVRLNFQAERYIHEFETYVAECACVRECYALSGQQDFLLKCVFRNEMEKEEFARQIAGAISNVEHLTVLNCLSICKEFPTLPLGAE
jgi:DNA-binding Lrp family transcriptional regulator